MGVPAFGGRYVPDSAIAPAASLAPLSPVAGFAVFHIANTKIFWNLCLMKNYFV
ncbi:MAG: hypothetical protein MR739_12360 [Spirochaetia bacterium]|nr:hypothetical protein [Spirochaetia bacterium]